MWNELMASVGERPVRHNFFQMDCNDLYDGGLEPGEVPSSVVGDQDGDLDGGSPQYLGPNPVLFDGECILYTLSAESENIDGELVGAIEEDYNRPIP